MPRDDFYFHSRWSISQQEVDFAVDGHFRSPFRSCEMRVEGCEMALVCQGVVLQLRNHLRNGGAAAKIGVFRCGGFRKAFGNCEMRLEATKWHSCVKGVFCNYENFRKGGAWGYERRPDFATATWWLQNYFAAKERFRRGPFWVAKFRSQWIFPCF